MQLKSESIDTATPWKRKQKTQTNASQKLTILTKQFLFYSDYIRPKNQMWVIGDDLLNSSFRHFMTWRNNSGKTHYINKTYEVTPYPVSDSNNFLIQIQNGLARAINGNTYLPDTLLILLSNIIPSDEVLNLKHEFYLKKIMQIIKETLAVRYNQLPKKAKAIFDTK